MRTAFSSLCTAGQHRADPAVRVTEEKAGKAGAACEPECPRESFVGCKR